MSDETGLSIITQRKICKLNIPSYQHRDFALDLLRHASCFNPKPDANPRPGWNGYMSMTSHGNCPCKSIVHMLPIIDLDPNDMYLL